MTKLTKEKELIAEWKTTFLRPIYNMCNVYSGKLFHYTTRDTLWNILRTNCFYARHVRFSNDSQEYLLGKREIERCRNNGNQIELTDPDDCYMICFCKENDILSQWREYARGGVSLELYFTEDIVYTILCNSKTEEENRKSKQINSKNVLYHIPIGLYDKSSEKYQIVYSRPLEVKYIREGDVKLKKCVEEIEEELKNTQREATEENRFLKKLLPYIKHAGFKEEKEARLVFDIDKYKAPYLVDYIDDKGTMKPYIRVQTGNAENFQSTKCKIHCFKIPKKLKEKINKGKIEVPGENETEISVTLELIDDLTQRDEKKSKYIFIEKCVGQQYIFDIIDRDVAAYNAEHKLKIKIWCGGYLPIRGITVGPSSDAVELCESIRHKIGNIFWLKYVDVDISKIPYRS